MKIDQPDRWPTRKLLTGSTIAAAVTEGWGAAWDKVEAVTTSPAWAGIAEVLSGSDVSMLVGALVAGGVGWLVRDRG